MRLQHPDTRVLNIEGAIMFHVSTTTPGHLKLVAMDTSLGPLTFADYYRFGAETDDSPLVIYVGGAISFEEYQKRVETEPLQVVEEFKAAFFKTEGTSVDLLVLPFPPDPDGTVHQKLFSILILDLLKQTPCPRPQRIGCVGFSLGSSFASYLSFSLSQVKVLAVLGGYGMSEGANESRMVGEVRGRTYQAWWNADSSGYMENLFFLHLLTKHDATMDIVTGVGGHEFTDYASNGSVRDAFTFTLNALLARG